MYSVGWRDGDHPIIRLATLSEENQRTDNISHNDMHGQGWVSEESLQVAYNNHNNMHGKSWVETCNA